MQTSLRPVVATSSVTGVGYQYYQHPAPHQHEHLEVMPETNSMLPLDESGLNISQYRPYDNYNHHHHQQLELIHHHHLQQVSYQQPTCYTSLGETQQQHVVDEHQVVAYNNVDTHQQYQLLEVPPRGTSQQQVVVEVEQTEMYQHHMLPEQQEPQQQQTSYQTIYYEPTVIEQPLIEQHPQNHHQVAAFAQLAPLPAPPSQSSAPGAPEGCYHQFQYHQQQLDHLPQPHIESCNLVLDASGQLTQVGAEPQVQAADLVTQANYTQDTYLQQSESFDDNGGNQETGEQLRYRAIELAKVKNLSSSSTAADYLQLQQQPEESVETTSSSSSLLIHSQLSTGMTHPAEHNHSLRHDHNHHHRHHRRDESLSSSASSTSSSASSSASSAASTSEESSASSLTRDERKAREANIPLSYYEIVNLSIEQFNEQLAKYSLSEAQLTLIKDIRRRGKNKVAAQSCRKRKMEQIFELQHEVHNLANRRRNLGLECGQLIKEHADLIQEYDKIYAIIQERMQQSPHLQAPVAPTNIT